MIRFLILLVSITVCASQPAAADALDVRGVGLVDMGEKGGCTGTLIAPDLVLTAGHCMLTRMNGRRMTAESFTFHPATRTGRPGPGFVGLRNAVHPVFRIPGLPNSRRIPRDLALLQLARPVPKDVATPILPNYRGDVEKKGFIISFRGAASTARQRPCVPLAADGGLIQLACKVLKGESGSPFLLVEDGHLSVIGVISASSTIGRQPIALAVDLRFGLAGLIEAFSAPY